MLSPKPDSNPAGILPNRWRAYGTNAPYTTFWRRPDGARAVCSRRRGRLAVVDEAAEAPGRRRGGGVTDSAQSNPSRGHLWLNLAALGLPVGSAWLLSGLLLLVPLVPVCLALIGLVHSARAIRAERRDGQQAEEAAERAQHFGIFGLSLGGIGLVIALFVVALATGDYP